MVDSIAKASITYADAQKCVDAAIAHAAEIGVPMAIAIVDESGVLKAFARMDGAALLANQVAQDKAYTACGFGLATDAWYDFIKDDGPLALGATGAVERLVVFGGGYPIKQGETVIGAIGASGGHYSQDMEVALAGIAAIE